MLGLSLTGCGPSAYSIKVNGYTDLTAPTWLPAGSSFFVIDNREAKNPLLEKEIKDKINKLLEKYGYRVASQEQADYYLFFAYGLGQERSVTPVAMPDYLPLRPGIRGRLPVRIFFFVSFPTWAITPIPNPPSMTAGS